MDFEDDDELELERQLGDEEIPSAAQPTSGKVKGLDFSKQAEPVDLPTPRSQRKTSPKLDFSGSAEPVDASPFAKGTAPIPRARPAEAPPRTGEVAEDPTVGGEMFIQPPAAEPPAPAQPVPLDNNGNVAVMPLDDAQFRSGGTGFDAVIGPESGMLTGEEAYKQKQDAIAATKAALDEARAAREGLENGTIKPKTNRLNMARRLEGSETSLQAAIAEARQREQEAEKAYNSAQVSAPSQGYLRDKAERVVPAAAGQVLDTGRAVARIFTGLMRADEVLDERNDQVAIKNLDKLDKTLDDSVIAIKQFAGNRLFKSDTARDEELGAKVTNGVVSTGTFVAMGALGRSAGLGAGATTAIAGALPQAEQQYQQAEAAIRLQRGYAQAWMKEKGINLSEDQANDVVKWSMFAMGLGIGSTEAIPIGHMFSRLENASGGGLTRYFGVIAAQAGEEGIQEGMQQLLQNASTLGLINPYQEIGKDVAENAIVGGLSGAMVTGVVAAPSALRGDVDHIASRVPVPEGTPVTAEEIMQQASAPAAQPGDQQTAQAPAPASAGEETGGPQPQAGAAAPASATDVGGIERRVLRKKGYTDEMIDGMSPAERAAEVGDAAEQGIEAGAAEPAVEAPATPRTASEVQRDTGLGFVEAKAISDQEKADFSAQATPVVGDGTRTSPAHIHDAADIERAAENVNTEPTDGQKGAGNYAKGHVKIAGLNVAIENPKGSVRSGTNPATNEPWQVNMPVAYGYVKRTKGKDGDAVDVFIGDSPSAKQAYIIDQIDPATGKFDEHKVMVGFDSQEAAEAAYDASFSDGNGAQRRAQISPVNLTRLKQWITKGNTKKPFGGPIKKAQDDEQQAISDAIASGDVTAQEVNAIYGEGVADEVQSGTAHVDVAGAGEEGVEPAGGPRGEDTGTGGQVSGAGETGEGEAGEGGRPGALDFSAQADEAVEGDTDTENGKAAEGVELDEQHRPKSLADQALLIASRGSKLEPEHRKALAAAGYAKGAKSEITDEGRDRLSVLTAAIREASTDPIWKKIIAATGQWAGHGYEHTHSIQNPDEKSQSRLLSSPLSYMDKEAGGPKLEAKHPELVDTPFANKMAKLTGLKVTARPVNSLNNHPIYHHAVDLANNEHWKELVDTASLSTPKYLASGIAFNIETKRLSLANARALLEAVGNEDPGKEKALAFIAKHGNIGRNSSGDSISFGNAMVDAGAMRPWLAIYAIEEKLAKFKGDHLIPTPEGKKFIEDAQAKRDGEEEAGTEEQSETETPAEESEQPEPTADEEEPETKAFVPTAIDKGERIEDAGQKIAGARKDAWADTGMSVKDLEDMSGAERHKKVTKENVWPRLDYAALVDGGVDPEAAHLIKTIYDRLPTKPANLDEAEAYVNAMNVLRDIVKEAKSVADVRRIAEQFRTSGVPSDERSLLSKKKGRYSYIGAGVLEYDDEGKAKKAVEQGFPNIEPWQRLYRIVTERGPNNAVRYTPARKGDKPWRYTPVGGPFDTKEEAIAKAKEVYEQFGTKEGPKEPTRPHLDDIARVGPETPRKGANKTGQDFIDEFGFRGVQFGNWAANDERQKAINLAFDALHDLARILNLTPKALSLNGTLGIAFGARGHGGKAAAHYEPHLLAINLTKLSGAGTLAHEWAHALDHYLGELNAPNAYGGAPKSISRWRNTSVKEDTFTSSNNRLSNLTPRLSNAANALMQSLHFQKQSEARKEIRLAELREKTENAVKGWRESAERAKDMLRKGENTRSANARLKKAEDQIGIWERWQAGQERMISSDRNLEKTRYYDSARALSGSGDYWHRPNEMFARAFEAYVFDKIAAGGDGHVSQYLVQGVEPDRYGSEYKGNPYPAGAERATINAAFDHMFRAIVVSPSNKIEGSNEEEPPEPVKIVTDKTHVPEITDAQKQAQVQAEMEALDAETKAMEKGDEKVNRSAVLAAKVSNYLIEGNKFGNILAARKFAKDAGFDGDAKAVEEAVELGVVMAARQIAARQATPKRKFEDLVDLYERQPKLGTRTSTSMRDQAFSTPVPLAYVASRLADITADVSVLEPSAGNGALLIEANPDKTQANEINQDRAENLKSLGFKTVSQDDAATELSAEPKSFDRVIENPPFGAVRQEEKSQVFDLSDIQPGYKTTEIDHAIALRSLAGMRDKGRAVLLLGGVNKVIQTRKGRSDAYNGRAKREFYKALYDRYRVTDHFTVAGELYERQGAGWPVDVIVIEGRGKSPRALPAVDVPRIISTWDALGEVLDGNAVHAETGGTSVVHAGGTDAGGNERADDNVRANGERERLPELGTEAGQPGDVQPGLAGERPVDAGADAESGQAGDEPGRSGDAGGTGTRPDAERRPPGLSAADAIDAAIENAFGPQAGPKSFEARAYDMGVAAFGKGINAAPAADPDFMPFLREVNPNGEIGNKESLRVMDAWSKGYMAANLAAPVPGVTAARPVPPNPFIKEPKAAKPRTTGEVAKSAAVNAVDSADAAFSGLYQLFGGGKTLGTLGAFDEDTYAKAKPMFVEAASKFSAFKDDIGELAKRMVAHMRDTLKWPQEVFAKMRPYLVRFIEDVQAGAVSLTQKVAVAAAPKAAAKQEQETEKQVSYAPKSATSGLGTLVPVNMRTSIKESLDALEKRVGDLDKFVASELGYKVEELPEYFAAEQIDAIALAIDNLKRNAGFIIGDQTGIGKGRVNAAIIRWAIHNKRIPVFVTEKPNLYGDMYRDLTDIGVASWLGRDLRIMATNTGANVPLNDDGTVVLKTGDASAQNMLFNSLNGGNFAKGYDVVFTTYSQMQTVKGKETSRRTFLERIAPSAVVIFDESHNAGGQGNPNGKTKEGAGSRSGFARDLVSKASGVFYSSATYAKRPDVMDLYSKTDMAMAVAKIEDLSEAIARGGVPMQQAVAAMLAKAGQYIRRERSFAGVTYDTVPTEVSHTQYDGISRSLAAIQDFSKAIEDVKDALDDEIKAEAEAFGYDNATGSAGASSVMFTSIMHNIINQMLLAMKAKGAAELAIEALKRGEKPVLTVANTMEKFLSDYAAETGIETDKPFEADFSRVLQKYLDRTRTLIIKKPWSKDEVVRKYLTDEELEKGGALGLYKMAESIIDSLDLSDLPVSPIDRIKDDLRAAGYKVGEITGRGTIIDYSGEKPFYRTRPGRETSIRGRRETIAGFNSGDLDAVIINQAGATGLSLHASEKFKDQRKRHMIVAQAEANIDTHMQMLGRVHRTGQVVTPTYSQLVAAIPAEKRPAAVLAKKMASLNANTTASRGGALTAKDVPDFMNEYGDLVAATLIADDMDLNYRLGSPIKVDENGKVTVEDAMRRLTGRIPLLRLNEQEELYQRLENEYTSLLEQMAAAGENALEAQTIDLKAKTLERTTVVPKKPGSDSPFADAVTIELVSAERQGKPYSPNVVMEKIGHRLGGEGSFADLDMPTLANMLTSIEHTYNPGGWGAKSDDLQKQTAREALDEFAIYKRAILDDIEDTKKQERERVKLDAVKDRWTTVLNSVRVGFRVTLKTAGGNYTAIVLDVGKTGEAKNPLALSTWKATFALADAARQVVLPFSRLYPDGQSKSDDQSAIELAPIQNWLETPLQTLERFASMQSGSREDRYIATGNLLAAYDWLNKKGRIIHYTDDQGHIRQGIMTAKGFDLAKHFSTKAKPINDPKEAAQWIVDHQGQQMWSEDNGIRVMLDGRNLVITTDAAKRSGGKFFLDKNLTALTRDFYKRGGNMIADVYVGPGTENITPIIQRLQQLGAVFVDRTQSELPDAEKVEEGDQASLRAQAFDDRSLTDDAQQSRAEIEKAVRDAIRQVAGPQVAARAQIVDRISGRPDSGWGAFLEQPGAEDTETMGLYRPAADLVMIALADNPDAIATAFHEGWHAIEDTLTPDEVAILNRETPRLTDYVARQRTDIDRATWGTVEPEEVWAEAAALYTRARAENAQVSGIHAAVRKIFERIRKLLDRIRNALSGLGFKTADDIFESFARGEMPARRANGLDAERGRWWEDQGGSRASIRATRGPGLRPASETIDAALDENDTIRDRISALIDAALLKPARGLWDRQIDLLRFQKAAEAAGADVGEHLDMYLAATLYPGRAGERMKDTVKKLWEPLFDAMAARNVSRDELVDYLYARHAPERNAAIRAIDPDNDAGSGMTDDQAAGIMDTYADRADDFNALAALVDGIVEANRNVMIREGLEDESTVEAWRDKYQHYVPLKGFEAGAEDELGGSPSAGRGFDVRRPESRRALGRFDRADDVLANLLDQTQRTIIRAEKNRVAKTALRFMQSNPSPFYKIGLAEKRRRIDPETGLVETYTAVASSERENVFAAKVGGKTYYIEIKHPGLLTALKTLGAAKMNVFLRFMSRLTREYSRFQTAKNPEFVLTNLARDLQDAGFNVSAEQHARFAKRFTANFFNGRALLGAILGIADKGDGRAARQWFEEWREAGGKISHYGLKDLDTLKAEIERELNERTESTGKQIAMAVPRALNPINGKVVKFLEALSDVTETLTRLAVYIAARESGFTKAQAAKLSRNATVDFNRSGTGGPIIGALYAFANANIQGNVRLLRTLRRSKIARRAAVGIVVAGMLTTLWNMTVSPEDKDKKKAYERRKYFERERNILLYWPGSPTALKIPLGYGLNVFWMMGEQLMMRALGKVGTMDAIGNVLGTAVDAFNPVGSAGSFFDWKTWARNLFPTVLRPIPEFAMNRNWIDKPIHPDQMPWTEGVPHSAQHKAYTHPAAVTVAEAINRWTGGNKFQPGGIDIYPDDAEYTWNFMVGGLGRFLANTSGTIADAVDGVERPVERIPFVRRFIASDNSPAVEADAYYDKRRSDQVKARQLRNAVKARQDGTDDGSADAVIEKLGPELGAAASKRTGSVTTRAETVFRGADKKIKELRMEEDRVRKDAALTRVQRDARIRALRQQMRDAMQEARAQAEAR